MFNVNLKQEEQAEDETYEEYEERVLNKRAASMFHTLKKKLRSETLVFSQMVEHNSRKQVSFISIMFIKILISLLIVVSIFILVRN